MRYLFSLVLFLATAVGGVLTGWQRDRQEDALPTRPRAETTSPADAPSSSDFWGVGYAQCEGTLKCDLAGTYADLGAGRVKIANIQWGNIEPNPPTNGQHEYQWWSLDHLVSNWQAAGYEVWILLRAHCDWAGVPPYDPAYPNTSTMPQAQYLDDYQDWVRAVVERYDFDTVDDMGDWAHELLAPVRFYEIESEAQIPMQWQGRSRETRVADYIELLGLARQAAQEAYADVQIVLSGIGTTDIFDDFPTEEQVEARIASLDPDSELMYREAVTFTQRTLTAVGLYDIVEFHANSDYTGLYGAVDWIRSMMPVTKPLWIGDASSAPMLTEVTWSFNPPYPGQTGEEIYQQVKDEDPATLAWLRREQAELTAKKLVVGLELGLDLVSPGTLTDWPELSGGKNWAYQGLVDGGMWSYDPAEDAPRPVFYTYRLLAQRLAGATSVERLQLSPRVNQATGGHSPERAPEIYAYRVTTADDPEPLLILWCEDYVAQLPGEQEGAVTLQWPAASSVVTVTPIITQSGQTAPLTTTLPVVEGQVILRVTETPILVKGVDDAQLPYESSPFGFLPARVDHPDYEDAGFVDAEYLGVRWHRPAVPAFWFLIQPDLNDPTYDWSFHDDQYGSVPEGIHILANITADHSLSPHGYTLPGTYIPTATLPYTTFVQATVERYDGDGVDDMPGLTNPITYWQVDNEPKADLTDFAVLQSLTYQAIKAACSTCTVLIGGSAGSPADYISGFDTVYDPILADLDGQYVDVFDFHWYGTADGEYRLRDTSTAEDVYDHIRAALTANGFAPDLPIWITEMGSYSGDPSEPQFPLQSERQQAGDYFKRYIYALAHGVGKVFAAFGLMEGFVPTEDGYFDHTGLIYDGEDFGRGQDPATGGDPGLGVKKLGYYTYKKMTEKLEGADWSTLSLLHDGTDDDHLYLFRIEKGGQPLYIAWWDYFDEASYAPGDTKPITLTGLTGEAITVTTVVPFADIGQHVTDYATAFTVTTYPILSGTATVDLGVDPVLVEKAAWLSRRIYLPLVLRAWTP